MNKTELTQALAKNCGTTLKQAGEFLDETLKLIGDELKKGNNVQLMGFGKFTASIVKGREGKNPRNPEETMQIPDTYRVYFSAGQALKTKVNERLTKKAEKKASKKASKKTADKKTKKK